MKNRMIFLVFSALCLAVGQVKGAERVILKQTAPNDVPPLTAREKKCLEAWGLGAHECSITQRFDDGTQTCSKFTFRNKGTQENLQTPKALTYGELLAKAYIYKWIAPKIMIPSALAAGACNIAGRHDLSIVPWSITLGMSVYPVWKLYNFDQDNRASKKVARRHVNPGYNNREWQTWTNTHEPFLLEAKTTRTAPQAGVGYVPPAQPATNSDWTPNWTAPGIAWAAWSPFRSS